MKIAIENTEKVQATLDHVQKRCRVRILTADRLAKVAREVEVRVNPSKLGRACKTITSRQSRFIRITFHDDFAEVFDATQLVPRDVRRIALRPNRQYGLTGNLDAMVTSGTTPPPR